jgi:hypothetical protein
LLNTCAPTPSTFTVGTPAASVVSAALPIGSTRTCELDVSLPHQSDDTSAIVAPFGCAATTLRARVSSLTTRGAIGAL